MPITDGTRKGVPLIDHIGTQSKPAKPVLRRDRLDVVLINPNDRRQVYQQLHDISGIEPPTFLLLVAEYLRRKGVSVEVIDQGPDNLSPEVIALMVRGLNPLLVGVFVYGYQPSASTQNMPAAQRICAAIKLDNPNQKIMMSGTHPAALPEQTLMNGNVDFVCDREGFTTILELLNWLKATKRPLGIYDEIEKVPDLWYPTWKFDAHLRSEDDLNVIHGEAGILSAQFTKRGRLLTEEELDLYAPMPAWDLIEKNGKLDHYRNHNWHSFNTKHRSPYASIYTSLGCPYKCTFCCINAPFGDMMKGPRPYRLWSPARTVAQIAHLVTKYGITNIKFVDEMFVLNPDHVFGITDRLTKKSDLGSKINIWAYARVDTAKPKFLESLKKAGFHWLCLGIESGNKKVRTTANKLKQENEDIKQVVQRIYDSGIYIIGNYIFGLPEDDIEAMRDTYDLAVDLNCEFSNFYSAMAYPGSPLYYQAVKEGIELPKSWQGYSQHGYETFPLRNKYVTSSQIISFRDASHMAYHSRPEYLTMISQKFGTYALDEIKKMLELGTPKRKILETTA